MIITRIRRGASRTNVLMKRNLLNLTIRQTRTTATWVRLSRTRIAAVALLAARIATTPVPVANAAAVASSPDSPDVPPSTLAVVRFAPTTADALQITTPNLQVVQVGVSRQTQADEVAKQQQEASLRAKRQAQYISNLQAEADVAAQQEAAEQTAGQTTSVYDQLYTQAVAELGQQEAEAMMYIGERESGVRIDAVNVSSGACGIWQALPCSKMGGMDLQHQYNWVKRYAEARYGSFVNAKNHWDIYHNW